MRLPDDWMVTVDKSDARLLLGLLAVSVGVVWCAAVLGLAVLVFRAIGGI